MMLNERPNIQGRVPRNYENNYKNTPTVDAVPVVRCKDCKHYNTIGCSKGFGWCENIGRGTSDNFYCAEAVETGVQDLRKEEEE